MTFPETNPSLLVRLRGDADEQAWFEFVELYRPAILRLAARRGLQPCDCDDLAQGVFVAVAGAIGRWEPDAGRGKFRTWLATIAHRRAIDALRKQSAAALTGGTSIGELLDERAQRQEDSRLLRLEVRRQVFQRVAHEIRDEFQESTWECFWLVAVEGVDVSEAARRTGRNVGAVYAAKGRVARRLIDKIRQVEPQFVEDES